jgi:hypothetical protein
VVLENQYLVVINYELETEDICYRGEIELEAFKRYKELEYKNKRIFKANVKMCKLMGYDFIESYEVIERIA